MHGFKSAILAIFQFWKYGTFELAHGIQNFFLAKRLFLKRMKMAFKKNIPNICPRLHQIQDLGESE
jgi:hypothetical protein